MTVTAQRELSDFEDTSWRLRSVRDVPVRGGLPNDGYGFAIDSGLFGIPIFGPLGGSRSPGLVIGSCVGGSLGRIRLRLFVGLGLPALAIPFGFRGLLPLALPLSCGAPLFLGPSRCGAPLFRGSPRGVAPPFLGSPRCVAFRLSPLGRCSRLSYLVKDLAPIIVIPCAAATVTINPAFLGMAAGRDNRTHGEGGDKNGNAQE